MDLFLKVTTNVPDLIIDYIEVKLKSGKAVSLNWEFSDVIMGMGGFNATYLRVCFDEERAKGSLNELKEMSVTGIGLYSELNPVADIDIKEMTFTDGEEALPFRNVYSAKGVYVDG